MPKFRRLSKRVFRHPSGLDTRQFSAKRPLEFKSMHLSPAGQAKFKDEFERLLRIAEAEKIAKAE